METKRLIITVAVLLLIVVTWDHLFTFVFSHLGYDTTPRVVKTEPTTAPAEASAAPATEPTTQSSVVAGSIGPATNSTGWSVASQEDAKPADLGSVKPSDSTFVMGLALSPQGAGIDSVTLNDYKQSVDKPDPYIFQDPYPGHELESRPLATRSFTLNGKPIDVSAKLWKLESADSTSARYSLDVMDGTEPGLHVVKTFQLFPRSDEKNGSGYEVLVTQTIENKTDRAMDVGTDFTGPRPPPKELERGVDRQVLCGYLPSPDQIQLAHHAVEEFVKNKTTIDLTRGDHDAPLVWAGACSIYFNALLRPDTAIDRLAAKRLTALHATALDTNPEATDHLVTLNFDSTFQQIPAGGSASLPLRVFFGPKLRSLLKSDYYSRLPLHYDETLVMTSGPCGFCTFDKLIDVLVILLGFFHFIFRDWGVAIIALVIVVRACLHPIMKRSQANMLKMGHMGPEIERLKKKYGEDKDAMSKAQMELMKQQGFTPILGCLPMFLQMPIFIALWECLQSTFELRQAPFLYVFGHHLTWIKDLAQPDKLISFSHPIPLIFIHIDAINLLPILVAVVSFINQKVTPKPPAATPEAAQQQKMMQWMTLVFPLMFYTLPSGLNLYYVTSTSLGILEGKIIRKHIKQKEEAEKAGRVIIDAKPTRASKQNKRDEQPPAPKRKGLMGWIASMQEKAEDLRNETDRRDKGKK